MNSRHSTVFENITLPAKALSFALAKNLRTGASYNWHRTFPVLAQLDKMEMKRSAVIFPNDCPNSAHDAYVLGQIGLPLDMGIALFEAIHQDIPLAIKDLEDKSFAQWFCLSPVHWRAGRDHVNLMALTDDDITLDETKVLVNSIAPWLAKWGWHIHVASPSKWFVRTLEHFDYHAPSLKLAQSDQLENFLPRGRALSRWQTLLTEIQMLWFENPVNQARAKRQQVAINSLWLYGGVNTRVINADKALQFRAVSASIEKPSVNKVNDIHAHLAWLDQKMLPVLDAVKTHGKATFSLLGDTWQQDIEVTQPSWTNALKSKVSTQKKAPLLWLEQPKFDFIQ
ncbi:hypothetical protein [Hydromonas duriensis]|uniref:Phosphoglycerate mutase n=1 Tax=Hydromonas duriensis TaxID=1527608 RepID=A0A4R6Y8Y5_9BURK|nr:hypothetical protein [Hydromonas duriensis]TDR31887.1 hypothetical protein DFR44_107104 [Hydromonas duriensis]